MELSSFGFDFIGLRVAMEIEEGLRYKLRTFGIPIDVPTGVFFDN